MSRKTAAQKARAAEAVAAASKTTTTETKRKHQGHHDQAQAKKSKVNHNEIANSAKKSRAGNAAKLMETPKPGETSNSKEPSKPTGNSKATGANDSESRAIPSPRLPGHPRPRPPVPPASISPSTLILPPEADVAKLRSQCDLHTISLTANSKMESKIQQTLQALQSSPSEGKSALIALTASSRAANKCVGVAEIAKRELRKEGRARVYQYTGCWTRLETHVSKPRRDELTHESNAQVEGKGEGEGDGDERSKKVDEGGDEEDDAFETAAIAERTQVRNTTCLVIYLALASVPRLREKYGEQVHEGDKG